ncbi:MAG: Na+/H+ antiporter NhaC family protein, partial [Oscillospiraceae bacterium]|nr:Na+/H+ antiporter NhaC family protein [Oscillospiraceae bacterium]
MELGFWSLVPPLLTIILALTTKNVFISLLIGILTGSLVLCGGAPIEGINNAIYSIAGSMSQGNTLIIGSILITGAVIYLMEKSGG